MRLYIR